MAPDSVATSCAARFAANSGRRLRQPIGLQVLDHLLRRERFPGEIGRAAVLAAAAARTGIGVEDLLPGELLEFPDAERLRGLKVPDRLDITRRLKRGHEVVGRRRDDVEQPRVGDVGDEAQGDQGMGPPGDLVEDPRRIGIEAGEGLGQCPAREGPDLPGGVGDVDPERLADKAGHDDPEQQQQNDRVIRGVVRLSLIAEAVGPLDIAAVEGQQDADQDGQAEEVHQKGEDQVEGPAQEDPSQEGPGNVSFLGDEGRPDEEDNEAEEDHAVHDPRIGIAEGLDLQKPVDQKEFEPLIEVVEAQLRFAKGYPELPAPVDAISKDRQGEGRQGIEKETIGFGVPVNLPPFVADRKLSEIHNSSLQ